MTHEIRMTDEHKLLYNPLSEGSNILNFCNVNNIETLIFDLEEITIINPIMIGIFKTLKNFYKKNYKKNLKIHLKNPPENIQYITKSLGYNFKII